MPPSRSALQHAVELKSASDNVTVTAIAAAPQFATESLLRALALGADNAALIKTDDLLDSPHDAARLVADLAGQKQLPCDLVLCGDAVLAAVLAGNLGQAYFSNVKDFVITGDQTKLTLQKPDASITTDGPVVLAMTDSTADIDFSVDDYLDALTKPLEIVDATQLATGPRFDLRYRLPEKPPVAESMETTPEAVAALVRKIAGVETTTQGSGSFAGKIESITPDKLPGRNAAVFVATPDKLDGVETAAATAAALSLPFHVLVLGHFDETLVRSVAARVNADSIYFASSPHLESSTPSALLAALQTIWKDLLPAVLASGTWANELLAQFARTFPRVQARYNVVEVVSRNGSVDLVTPAFGGKVQRVATIGQIAEHPLVMTVAGGAESGKRKTEGEKQVSLVPLEFEYDAATDELARALQAAHDDSGVTVHRRCRVHHRRRLRAAQQGEFRSGDPAAQETP